MSSRAAAGRKKLRPPQNPPNAPSLSTPSKGGFFSRSKSTAQPPPILADAPSRVGFYPDAKSQFYSEPHVQEGTPDLHQPPSSERHQYLQDDMYQPYVGHDTSGYPHSAVGSVVAAVPQNTPSGYPFQDRNRAPSRGLPQDPPSIPTHHRHHPTVPLGRSASVQPSYQQTEAYFQGFPTEEPAPTFLEASYQPPPPVQSNSGSGAQLQSSQVLPAYPISQDRTRAFPVGEKSSHPVANDTAYSNTALPQRPSSRPLPIYSEDFLSPHDIHIGPPSPASSPPTSSLLLQTSLPPVSSELPVYTYPSPNVSAHRDNRQQLNAPAYSRPQLNHLRYEPSPSSYPSPPISNPRFSPSPLRHEGAPEASTSSLQLDNIRQLQQPSFASYPPSSIPSSSSPSSEYPQRQAYGHANPTPSINSSTSQASQQPSLEQLQTAQAPAVNEPSKPFIFPGSRSVARPKLPNSAAPGLRLRGKRSKSKNEKASAAEGQPVSPTSPVSPEGYVPSINAPSVNSSGELPRLQAGSTSPNDLSRPRTNSLPGANTASSGATAPFVFPSSRSRATPKGAPKAKSSRSRKDPESSREVPERSKFMGILLKKKKKPITPTMPSSPLTHTLTSMNNGSVDSDLQNQNQKRTSINSQHSSELSLRRVQSRGSGRGTPQVDSRSSIKQKVGSYPLDPYDATILDNDRHTGDLLHALNSTKSPSFHNYGNMPPATVLDLGCGQGHWVLEAAITWKGYGTRVTGFDMVDISKGMWPWAIKQGVAENIKFVRGNFLKQQLPFPDQSFDLVRMSCLTLAITSDRWEFVLQEVCRVLTVGGRLEVIDDHIFFPYGKGPLSSSSSILSSHAPRLDINIPSSTFSTLSISDVGVPDFGGAYSADEHSDGDFYDLYGVEEEEEEAFDGEGEFDDTATLGGHDSLASADTFGNRRPPVHLTANFPAPPVAFGNSWKQQASTSRDLEALFEHMLSYKYGVHPRPSEFILDLMKKIFGHAREVSTMHLTLAPPEPTPPASTATSDNETGNSASPRRPASKRTSNLFSQSPGLILWPSTFIPMKQSELEIHSSKHLRMLLSCKNSLVEYAVEATEDEEIDEESVLEALWEYEGFLRLRFSPPREAESPPIIGHSPVPNHERMPSSDTASMISVSSENRDAMWEYQSELGDMFGLPSEETDFRAEPDSPEVSRSNQKVPEASATTNQLSRRGTMVSTRSTVAPPYSRIEMTHVRTFHVYEAIKMDGGGFTTVF